MASRVQHGAYDPGGGASFPAAERGFHGNVPCGGTVGRGSGRGGIVFPQAVPLLPEKIPSGAEILLPFVGDDPHRLRACGGDRYSFGRLAGCPSVQLHNRGGDADRIRHRLYLDREAEQKPPRFHRNGGRDRRGNRREDRAVPGALSDPGHVPLRLHHSGRHAVRCVPSGGRGIFLLSGHPCDAGRQLSEAIEVRL